jgi:hypothetical protein
MGGLHTICLYIVDVGPLRKIHIGKHAFLICRQNKSTILEATKTAKTALKLIIVEIADLWFGCINEVDIASL